jgi:hypothetical protein
MEMDLVVNQLSKIEAAAQKIMSDTTTQKEELSRKMNEQMKKYDEQVDIQTSDALSKLQEELKIKQKQNLLILKSSTEQAVANMETEYLTNHTQIAENLLKTLIRE